MTHPTDDELEAMAVRLEDGRVCSPAQNSCRNGYLMLEAAAMLRACKGRVSVDGLAQIIRTVDGSNSLGAGALAEAILAALEPAPDALEAAEMSAKHWHARAKAAESERDAALEVLSYIVEEDDAVIYCDEAATALTRAATKARAIIARHQKETDT